MSRKKKRKTYQVKKTETLKTSSSKARKKTEKYVSKFDVKRFSPKELGSILILSLVIIFSSYLLYNSAIDFDLVYCDDNIFLQDYYHLNKDVANLTEVFNTTMGTSYYRPILSVSLITDTQLSLASQFPDVNPDMVNPKQISPKYFHLTNVLLHIFASVLVFIFILKLGYPIISSFLFSMIVVVHPLLTPAASWISGRNDSLITVFILLSFISMIFYMEKKNFWMYIAFVFHILFFGISLFTKEIAAFFPFVCLAYLLFFIKEKKITNAKYLILVAGQFVMGMVWYFMRKKAIEGINNPDTIGLDALPDTYLTVPAIIGKFILPIKMIALSSYESFSIITGLIVIIVVIIYFIKSKKLDKSKAFFGIVWFSLLLAPTLLIRIIFVGDFFDYAEHRAYLIMVGMLIFALEVLKAFNVDFRKHIPIIVMSVIILLFGVKSYSYKDEFQNRKTFWSHMTDLYPYKSRGYLDLGKAYLVEDSLKKAEELYHLGIERNPRNKNLYIDLAAVYLKTQKYKKAEQYALYAISIEPNNTIAHYNLGKAYFQQQKYKESVDAYSKACRNTKYPDWFKELGDAYYRLGKFDNSIQSYQRAISGNQRNFYAYTNMGLAFVAMNRIDDAEASWNKALELNPSMQDAYYNLIRLSVINKNQVALSKYIRALKQNGGTVPTGIANLIKKANMTF